MPDFQTLSDVLLGTDVKIRRQVRYWGATVLLYSLCVGILWSEVSFGEASPLLTRWLTMSFIGGVLVFYALIRSSTRIGLSPAQLATYQGNFAIVCIVAAYATAGPIRGAMLTILLVILVFCAFTLQPAKSRTMSIFAIGLLGVVMLVMASSDPLHFKFRLEAIHFLLAAATLLVVAYLIGQLSRLRADLTKQKTELAEALTRIQTLATRDELTLLVNRRYMTEILAHAECRQRVQGRPACLALLDIDWFKQINDTYGHPAGDEVLRLFAQRAQTVLRSNDVLARWGGEEFLLLLPDTDLHTAKLVLDRVREQVITLRFPDIAPSLVATFSAGLVALCPGEPVASGIKRADHAMYVAKSQGRNRVVLA